MSGRFPLGIAYGRLTGTSNGLSPSVINIAGAGQAPQDGFTEYQGYPGQLSPRGGAAPCVGVVTSCLAPDIWLSRKESAGVAQAEGAGA
jgi:hypothetical protein